MACLSSGVVPSETRPLSIHFIPAPEEEVRVGAPGCFPRSRYKPLFRNCFSIRNDQSICLRPTAPSTHPDRQYFLVWPDQGNKVDWDTFNLSPCSQSLGGSATDYISPHPHTHTQVKIPPSLNLLSPQHQRSGVQLLQRDEFVLLYFNIMRVNRWRTERRGEHEWWSVSRPKKKKMDNGKRLRTQNVLNLGMREPVWGLCFFLKKNQIIHLIQFQKH